ncbi:ParM/StbA family protein [Lysinibacillus sp. G4S2]|uniref:ParM/StbA family protein n=1 Tax=Lysinibacillus sp. G4S2 TaxID=3055859 RepID=UPI0025A30A08|nr:ParM/StbA family protein [Lysinibacillus sp. G4S2]MDM5250086.1 ParM/StbA family protein [Lysinibacillus sp. G4S2]
MKEHAFVAIDSGKYATKAIMEYKEKTYILIFRTKMQEVSDIGIDIQSNSFKVELDGKQYLLGDMVSENKSDFNLSKETLIHKLAIYTAIVELMKKANAYFHNVYLHVAVNVPITVYKNKTSKDSFKEYIENKNKTIYLRINDNAHVFNLNDLTICFEGMGLVFANTEEYSKYTTAVFDIGGLNTTYCIFNGIQPNFNSMTVSHLGINTLKARLEQELVQRYNKNVSANDLEQIIKKGYFSHMGKIDEESREIIQKIKAVHLEQILSYAKQHDYTFNQDKIIFSGGGALLLQQEIQNSFPNATTVINPQFANVKSFLEIIKVKYSS